MFREQYASVDEAFAMLTPDFEAQTAKMKAKERKKRQVPSALVSTPASAQQTEPSAVSSIQEPEIAPVTTAHLPAAATALNEAFSLPGETASPDEWTKAFTLAPSSIAFSGFSGFSGVDGKSTSWRKQPVPIQSSSSSLQAVPIASNSLSNLPLDIQRRFDQLAQQLEGLTSSTPMQNTAELFLFIAIGLLFILAIDSLLRFATSMVLRAQSGGRFKMSGGAWGKRFR
jgi:hypothetical protein